MNPKYAWIPLLFAVCYHASFADERFPDSDIQWILEQYHVSEPTSLIPDEGLAGWTRYGGGQIANPSKWTNQDRKLVFEYSERTQTFQGRDIVTEKQYTNFVLDFVWMASRGCNSGIKYRIKNFGDTGLPEARYWLGCEFQILDTFHHIEVDGDPILSAASLYELFAPNKGTKKLNPFGEVNTGRIIVMNNHIEHWLNGKKVMQCEVGSDAWQQAVAKSKFSDEQGVGFGFGENASGFISLQDHGNTITFEKIVIREIGAKK